MDERLASLKLLNHIVPPLTIAAKGQQVLVRFPVSPMCDMSHLIVDVVARLGGPMNDGAGSCGNEVRALLLQASLTLPYKPSSTPLADSQAKKINETNRKSILGNLACHSKPEKVMVSFEGLVPTVIQQLQFEDPPSLCETCRLGSAGLHSDVASAWINALQREEVLERIIILCGSQATSAMNSQLREKSAGLILAIVDSEQEALSALLPTLLRIGLPGLLTDFIEGEVTAITGGTSTCGDAVLDIVLQIAEALSIPDEFATQLERGLKKWHVWE